MDKKKAGWKQKLILLTVSSLFVIAMIGLGEIYCRLFTRINFLDSSRGLFTYNRYGNSYGNTPNFEGISFGEKFYTDSNGFRIDPQFKSNAATNAGAILIMGDSVAFGPAVAEDKTISGILRRTMPDKQIYNGAVIGYDTFDYKNAVASITADKPEIKSVLLFFCLNDVNDASAQVIRSQSSQAPAEETDSPSIARRVNDYLRSRSKLYLWLKNLLIDTQMFHFRNDLSNYQRGESNVNEALQPIVEMKNGLDNNDITLKVFIMPYEAQLRPDTPSEFLQPQRLLASFFQKNGINYYDVTEDFQKAEINKKLLFLYGDPMHLSADGNKLVAGIACSNIPGCKLQ